ncbi:MAG TPA: beta-CASP ribonuclease aCPSF1 [Thermoprotei archaeon]|nr:beta-CASP ribonuclease aCPSF1 [TACK group archaeon]HEV51732.1 beta-CASP ribonuclease aCPSF1 [Thermoprotei archaeon]
MADYDLEARLKQIREVIFRSVPPEARLTKVEFEGPNIALYCEKPQALLADESIVRSMAKQIKTRIIVRTDPSQLMPQEDAEKLIRETLGDDIGLESIIFNEDEGEVMIVAKKYGPLGGPSSPLLKEIAQKTGWRPLFIRAPPIKSATLKGILSLMNNEGDYRKDFLREVGQSIHRPLIYKNNYVTVRALGGFQEVGRSSILVETASSKVLLDCGVKPGAVNRLDEFPRLDAIDFDLDELDAVIISHAHLDHMGFLPYLFKYGYRGPVYMTRPTMELMALLQSDYMDITEKGGEKPPYGVNDYKKALLHTIPLEYGEVVDISPDVKATLYNAGHILGSAITHLHIGEGEHNIVYTGDFKYADTRLLQRAETDFPRVETLIMESTYGAKNDIMVPREEAERQFIEAVRVTLEHGGRVLIPVLSVGRAQELMVILAQAFNDRALPKTKVHMEGLLYETTALHMAHPEVLSRDLRDSIYYDENPFMHENFDMHLRIEDRQKLAKGEPCIIMAPAGMLTGGPALDYLKYMVEDEKNSIIFTSYQAEGTLGRKIAKGANEIQLEDEAGQEKTFKVLMKVIPIEGLSGHSDRRELVQFVERLRMRPKTIIVNHGEPRKIDDLASYLRFRLHVNAFGLEVMDAIRVY